MGLVGKDKVEEAEEAEKEDTPVVKQLKEIDDKYLALEKEYEKEVAGILKKYENKQKPFLDERKQVLTASSEDGPKTGTPAVSGFWFTAMSNHPAVEDILQEWDEPVLEYLEDIEKEAVDEDEDGVRGFKLKFHFVANPYFEHKVLEKEYKFSTGNPYCGELDVKSITCTEIEWHAGKDVTVEKVAGKKPKGGGAKKAKQKKEKEEPRPSFFRDFFRNLAPGSPLPEDAKQQAMMIADGEADDDDGDEELMAFLMEADHEIGSALRDNVIPFAVRWYTGEAAPDMDFDDEGEESEEEDGDEDEEESSEDDDPKPKKGGKAAPPPKGKKGGKEGKAGEEPKEECKQQ